MTTPNPEPSFKEELGRKLVAGGIAGVIGTTIIYPIDIIKTHVQTSSIQGFWSKWNIAGGIWKSGGFKGYYQGLSANLIGVTPEKAIKLTVNDLSRQYLAKRLKTSNERLPAWAGMAAGAMAGTCQVLATNPMEMVKINMQLASQYGKRRLSLMETVNAMGVRGLYAGTLTTLMRDIPFSMIFFQSFASISEFIRTIRDEKGPLSAGWTLTTGISAGTIGAILATPMDLVKTRYQAEWFAARQTGLPRPRIGETWTKAVEREGIKGLFKGSLQRCMIVGPLFGISLMVFEIQKSAWSK